MAKLDEDIKHLVNLYNKPGGKGRQGTLIIRTEHASDTYTTDLISKVFEEEAHGIFDSKTVVLGHTQQGGAPSPLDRIRATRLAARCVRWLLKQCHAHEDQAGYRIYTTAPSTASVIGIVGADIRYTPVTVLKGETDMVNRRSLKQQWMDLGPVIKILAKYGILVLFVSFQWY